MERLEARVTKAQKRIIERAAEIRGTTLTDFLLVSAQQAATAIIKEFEMLTLRDESRAVFINALLSPPAPNAAARAATRSYRERTVK
jgi:uncharacterized protein (DUF1778 family)